MNQFQNSNQIMYKYTAVRSFFTIISILVKFAYFIYVAWPLLNLAHVEVYNVYGWL